MPLDAQRGGGLNRELTIVGADGEKTMSRVEVAW